MDKATRQNKGALYDNVTQGRFSGKLWRQDIFE